MPFGFFGRLRRRGADDTSAGGAGVERIAGACVVGANFGADRAAQGFVNRNAMSLAGQIPQSEINSAGGAHLG